MEIGGDLHPTEWDAFRALDLKRLKAILAIPRIIDLRNIYRPELMRAQGFMYEGVGVPQFEVEIEVPAVAVDLSHSQ